jgi:uncharacterized membrane protein HdeD (DUF308 family)
MQTSLFLARFFGLYLITIGLVLIIRRDFFQKAISNFMENPAIIFWSGIMALVFGLLVFLAQPIFAFNWMGLITLFALLSIFKGILRLFLPNKEKVWLGDWWKGKKASYVGYALILCGLFLSYHGFMVMG